MKFMNRLNEFQQTFKKTTKQTMSATKKKSDENFQQQQNRNIDSNTENMKIRTHLP